MGIFAMGVEALSLKPVFGNKPWSPESSCADVHPRGKLPDGSKCCCMAGHESGVEWHRCLVQTAADFQEIAAWKPEKGRDEWSEPEPQPTKYQGDPKLAPRKTSRQRRAERVARKRDQRYAATSSPN